MTTTAPDPQPTAPELESGVVTPAVTTPGTAALLRRLALRVHFFAGILVAPFLAVLCLTGIIYVFMPQVNNLVYHNEYFVDSHSAPARPLAEQVQAALLANPGATLTSVITPAGEDRTTAVVLSVAGLESEQARTVYLDPYTAQVRGALTTTNGRPPLQQWLRDLHGNLHLGTPGRLYSEVVASWLPVLIIGGLILWIGRRRKRKARDLLLPERGGKPGRARTRNRHGALGLWLSIGLLAISVTGLTWSNYAGDRFDTLVTAMDAHTPTMPAAAISTPIAGVPPISVDDALGIARTAGLRGSLTVTPPSKPTTPFTIKESFQTLPVRSDSVGVDPYTGRVVAELHFTDYPLAAKLTTLGILAHSGTLFGPANQIGMALLALGTLTMIVLAYRMWWKRRPLRSGGLPGAPAKPVWSQLSQPVVLVVLLSAAALSWALPVLGMSLVVFLLADFGVLGIRRLLRHRIG
ncbi:MAG: hypothetical protein QOI21_2703 [Actinomycetota bacterium]|jgi:uncharacterized iron-regulated membrane protein|nr:hypothetical protein [Actinomycetota bacterium]